MWNLLTVIGIIFIIVNIFYINKGVVYAQHVKDGGKTEKSSTSIIPDFYKPSDPTTDDAEAIVDKVGTILGAVRNVSAVVSVIILMIIGIKYIFGSVEEKANYKATMIPYIIGCIMAVSGTTIVSFIYSYVH